MNGLILYEWSGEAMVPVRGFQKQCDEQFVVGMRYRLEVIEDRSRASHSHFFASLQSAWDNLPDELVQRYPSVEHLRKAALIHCGFADERSVPCATRAEALRIAAFIKPLDDYAIVVPREAVVTVYIAKSQSLRAMGKKDFEASKSAVLDYVASLIGSTAGELAKNAGVAA